MDKQAAWNALFRYEEGVLYWRKKKHRRPLDKPVGWINRDGYCMIKVGGVRLRRANIVYEMHYGAVPSELIVDHKDRDRTNDCIWNLRVVDYHENNLNRGKYRG